MPTQLRRLLDAGARPGARLRVVLLGGGPRRPTCSSEARAAGWPVAPPTGSRRPARRWPSTAAPLPGLAVTLADDGEILVEGPTVAGGGLLRTGDLGRFDERGRLT